MDFKVCAQCGGEIEGQGVLFKKKHFCCDECCEEFEDLLLVGNGPDPVDLDLGDDVDIEDESMDDSADLEDLDEDLDLDLDDLDEDLDLDDDF